MKRIGLCAALAAGLLALPGAVPAGGEWPAGGFAVSFSQTGEAAAVPEISARACLLMDAATGAVLYAKNERESLPMASTTKIMTALLTLEQPDLDTYFTVDPEAIRVEGSSMGLMEGDQVSLYALAGGMLLASGNDAANAAAVRIDGSLPAFVERMNRRAAEIGMEDTHFATPSGLDGEGHASTARDMALLAREALRNDAFRELCGSRKAKLRYGSPPFDRWLSNHNRLLSCYDGCIGVKTGFTEEAGRCLVSAAKRDGVTLICVTLDDPEDWTDHANLLDYGFSRAGVLTLSPGEIPARAAVAGGERDAVALDQPESRTVPAAGEPEEIEREVLLRPFCYAPVEAGETLGFVRFLADGQLLAEIPLTAAEEVPRQEPEPGLWERLRRWLGIGTDD